MSKGISYQNTDTGELIADWDFTPSQSKFWDSKAKFVLFSGGYGSGKSLCLTLKAIDLAVKYPDNYILMGRKTYPELRDSLIKEFFLICPDAFIANYLKAEGRVVFFNGSEIIFRHLDTIAAAEIRSMNLGAAFIDQVEEVEKEVFEGLRGRLRRKNIPDEARKIYMTCNPALTWLFADFKQKPIADSEVIESSTMENAKNLPQGYLDDLMRYPESYRKQFVEGIWDTDLLSENTVFAREHIAKLIGMERTPKREVEGLKIYEDFVPGHDYQMGIDASEGAEATLTKQGQIAKQGDEGVIVIADMTTLEEVAHFAGRLPPGILGEKAKQFARMYSDKNKRCLIIPEMNSIGVALVNKLKESGDWDIRIFKREEYDKTTKTKMERYGWRTTRQTKPLLISRFQERLRLQDPKIYTKETIEQFKSFVWTDETKKQGAGATRGFHDDRVIATLLAFWQRGEITPGSVSRSGALSDERTKSGIMVKNGKLIIPQLAIERKTSWMTN